MTEIAARQRITARRKIVFIAIVAYTGEIAHDGRILEPPEDRRLRHRDFPLPVLADLHWNGHVQQIGTVEHAALCDRRLIIFGHLDPGTVDGTDLVAHLDQGELFFEIDLDDITAQPDSYARRFSTWRLAAVTVGDAPCWWLPKTQIEVMNVKEETYA